ncbi:hypothetical protein IWQ61_001579 [Dispira simplex]|nr:hypothetical protein IWQ61_001579 [Dispira simplex]
MACSIPSSPQRCHGKAGAGQCRILQSPDEVEQTGNSTPFYCRKHWRQAGRNQASPGKPLKLTTTQQPIDLAISLSRLSLGSSSQVLFTPHPSHPADPVNPLSPEENQPCASPTQPHENPTGFHSEDSLVSEPSNVNHLPTKFSPSKLVTRWYRFRAQKLKLPVYSDVIHPEQALYGTMEISPNGKWLMACQAFNSDGTTRCRKQVTVGKDPRHYQKPNDRVHWYCHIHRDKPHQAAKIRDAVHSGKYKGVIDRQLPYSVQHKLYNELEKPISIADAPGFIYVFQLVSKERPRGWQGSTQKQITVPLKIGRTNNVSRRMQQWKGQCGYELYLLEIFPLPLGKPTPSVTKTLELLSKPFKRFNQKIYATGQRDTTVSAVFLNSLPEKLQRYLLAKVPGDPSPALSTRSPSSDNSSTERKSNSVDQELPRCKYAAKAERLIHLHLGPQQHPQDNCAVCGNIHKEWFDAQVPRSAFLHSDTTDSGYRSKGWHIDPQAWYKMEIRSVIVHWLKYLQDQHGVV